MAARGSKKRKLVVEDPGITGAGPSSPPSGSRDSAGRRLVEVVADPDSDRESCDSLLSDANSSFTRDDAVEVASRLLMAVVGKSPEALLAFVRRA
uniref:Uncharacterized protein n=1 Tax=Oryza punctata TaxID=4537 RepID=A0A0E0KW23_ORYPU